MAKWDASMDRVDHMAVGDYKRAWAIHMDRPVDYADQIALEDAMEATSLPYAVTVLDDRPILFDESKYPESDRAGMMQQLEAMMLESLPKMARRWRPRGVGDGGEVECKDNEGEEVEDVGVEEWEEE